MSSHRQQIILHPAFVQGRLALARALQTDMRGQLIFVVGLSGAGKSEIRYDTMRAFAGPPSQWGTGMIPAIAARASPSTGSHFSTKEFMERIYLELLEPKLDWIKRRSDVSGPDEGHQHADARLKSEIWSERHNQYTETQLRTFVERLAPARGLCAIFIEEAASLTYTQSRKNPVDHMVNYMCLAEEIGVTLVLFGVPRTSKLWENNAQILRRARFVWVDRYTATNPAHRKNFGRLVAMLAERYQFSKKDILPKQMDIIYAATAGVFGGLKAYLRRADDIRASEDAASITTRHLEEAVSSETVLRVLHQDAEAFDALRTPASAAAIRRVMSQQAHDAITP